MFLIYQNWFSKFYILSPSWITNFFSALGSTAGSIADTDRGTDEELDDFNEEEENESFSALYRLVNEESPPPEMPQPKRKTSVASVEAR